MLGGYFLGQIYLGISGLPSSGELTVQSSIHSHSVDNITLIQQHVIALSNASHSLTSDNLDLIEHKTLVVNSAVHSLISDVIALTQAHTIVVANTTHGLTSDEIAIIQRQLLEIADASHSLATVGDLELNQFLLLNTPDSSIIGVTSPEIWIAQNNILVVEDSYLGLIDNLTRIINLADYQYFTGIYIKDFSDSGDLEETDVLEAATLILKNKNFGSLEPAEIDSGVFIKTTDKQGQLN